MKKKKLKNKIAKLKAEIADAHAFVFNILPYRTKRDMKYTLDEQIEKLNQTIEVLLKEKDTLYGRLFTGNRLNR